MTRNLKSMLPARRDANSVLNVTLPCLLVVSFATGWIASLLGLTDFGLHRYSSIAVFVVAFAHLGLHWRSLVAHLRRRANRPLPMRPLPLRPVLRLVEQIEAPATFTGVDELRPTGTGRA